MATIPKKAKNVNEINSVDVLNAIRNKNVGTYQDLVPLADGTVENLREIGEVITSYQTLKNMFLNSLVDMIAQVIITSRLYENPWKFFKKGYFEYGETIEEIYVNLAKPYQYTPDGDPNLLYKRYLPDVKSAFHSVNYRKMYPTTVGERELKGAFYSFEGVNDLISRIVEQVYTGANYDEFLVMKYMIAKAALNGYMYPVKVDANALSEPRSLTSTMVNQARLLKFMSSEYNYAGVPTYTDPRYLVTILTTQVSSILDVEVLALSFHMDKAELIGRITDVDYFGKFDEERMALIFEGDPYNQYTPFTEDEKTSLASIIALMCDEKFFMIYDNYENMTDLFNPRTVEWTYFYHVWRTISFSPFSNAILFTSQTPAITSVTVTPPTTTATKGSKISLSVDVKNSGFASKAVKWSVDSSISSISPDGVVTIPTNETASSVIATATSVFDSTKTGTCTIELSQ